MFEQKTLEINCRRIAPEDSSKQMREPQNHPPEYSAGG